MTDPITPISDEDRASWMRHVRLCTPDGAFMRNDLVLALDARLAAAEANLSAIAAETEPPFDDASVSQHVIRYIRKLEDATRVAVSAGAAAYQETMAVRKERDEAIARADSSEAVVDTANEMRAQAEKQRDAAEAALGAIRAEAGSSAVVEDDETAKEWFRKIEDIASAVLGARGGEGTAR